MPFIKSAVDTQAWSETQRTAGIRIKVKVMVMLACTVTLFCIAPRFQAALHRFDEAAWIQLYLFPTSLAIVMLGFALLLRPSKWGFRLLLGLGIGDFIIAVSAW